MQQNPLSRDLDHILSLSEDIWSKLKDKRLFITGGTGFFGCWLLESLIWANERFNLNAFVMVLTRNAESFKVKAPHLAGHPSVQLYSGDIRDFTFPAGRFSHIIHAAATSAVATFRNEDPLVKFDTVVQGTRHVLDFAIQCGAEKFLYTSSGAVYGRQPADLTHISEDFRGAPDPVDPISVWGESKRAAELLCTLYHARFGLETKIARCFSFVGPYLQLNIHYAAGNFIRDGLAGVPLKINGDGTPRRSFLYAADLAVWLWTIFLEGEPGCVYNVGSEEEYSISELAHTVARCFSPQPEVLTARQPGPENNIEHYVPATGKAEQHLGLRQTVALPEALAETIKYYRQATPATKRDL